MCGGPNNYVFAKSAAHPSAGLHKYFKKSLLFVLPEKMQHLTLISFEALKWNECYHLSCYLNHCLGHST